MKSNYKVKKEKRKFKCCDAVFLQFVELMILRIEEYHPHFEDFSSSFTPESLQNLKNLSAGSRNIKWDRRLKYEVAETTSNLENEMKQARMFYHSSMCRIQLKYPGEMDTWKSFGYANYGKSKSAVSSLLQFLRTFKHRLEKHKEKLDFAETAIAEADIHINKIMELLEEQKYRKDERTATAVHRVQTLNEIYDILTDYFKVAKIIFHDNDLIRGVFCFKGVNYKSSKTNEATLENSHD